MINNKFSFNSYLNNKTMDSFLLNKYLYSMTTLDHYLNKKQSNVTSESSILHETLVEENVDEFLDRINVTFGSRNLLPE